MSRKTNQRIVLAISGGIAAHKSVEVIRALQKRGYNRIDTILTRNGAQFVTPVTLEAITRQVPYVDAFESGRALSHIDLVQPCGILAVVPATANIIAKFAHGIADDFLSTCYLACTGPVLVAPAMNIEMYKHPTTVRNLAQLRNDSVYVLEPDEGYLACGAYGAGRMPDVDAVADHIELVLHRAVDGPLTGKSVLISSGGTAEPIDPVRTITNRSTGRMGKALAEAFALSGADVQLVSGPSEVRYPAYCDVTRVESASDMSTAVLAKAAHADIIIMAAAVADYTPEQAAAGKIKKKGMPLTLSLKPTTDILKTLGNEYQGQKILIGFAAETENVVAYAREKLAEKGTDLVVGNQVGVADSGFGVDTSRAFLVRKDGSVDEPGVISKEALAFRIVSEVVSLLEQANE